MKKLLIIVCVIALFTNCNNSSGGGWSSLDRQKGLKACMDQVEGKLEEASAKKFCNCALEGAMRKWKTYAESENAPDDDPAGVEIGKNCMAALQGGNDPEEPKKKGGGLFGGGGSWSKTDKNTFQSQCENSLVGQGYDQSQARQLCSCVVGKLEKKYSSLNEANEKGGEAAGASAIQECAGGGGGDDNGNNDDNEDNN